MNKLQISGIAAMAFLASCSPKEKTGDLSSVSPKTDPMAIQTPMDTTSTETAATAHNSQNSLEWNGTYEAVVPCADCPGIKTTLLLNKDKTFSITEEYIDRNSKNNDKGTFDWDATGSVITLNGKSANYKYKVGENKLFQLDMDGKEITGPNKDLYVFNKK